MKKLLFAVIATFALTTASAQEEGKVRVGLDLGVAIADGGAGFIFNLEPKYNLADNMNVGLRFGVAGLVKNIQTDGDGEPTSANVSGATSFLGTYDYYFELGGAFNPFIGAGLGYVRLASVSLADGDDGDNFDNGNIGAEGKFGFMVRGGFEAAKFRLTVEYDIIGKTTLNDFDGNEIGSITNNYLGITAGFYIGGGKW